MRKLRQLPHGAMALSCALALPSPAHADAVEDLRKEVAALRAEIELLKAAAGLTRTAKTAETPTPPDKPRMEYAAVRELPPPSQPGERTPAGELPAPAPAATGSWTLSGFAKLDVTHDRTATAPYDFYANLPEQPLSGSGAPRGTTRFTGQASRIAVDGATRINGQPLVARIETDFYAYGNTALQNRLRLRRAYAEYGGWMMGINASTFVDIEALPETLDLNGPIGSPSARKGQVRYQWTRDSGLSFALAAEDPEAGARMPNLVARLDQTIPGGSFNLRYMAHEKRAVVDGLVHARRGRGAGLGINYKPNEAHLLSAQYTYMEGDFDYLMGANGFVGTPNGVLLDRSQGLVVGWTYTANSRWRGTASYGLIRSTAPAAFQMADGLWLDNRTLQQAHLNVIYSPVPAVDLGIELILGRRTDFQRQTGELERLLLSGKVAF